MSQEISASISFLEKGKTLLYPTDTVFGIGCDATNVAAVKKVYQLKKRDDSKALICLVNDLYMLEKYVGNIPEKALEILESATKPTTVIYSNPIGFAKNLIAQDKTIAIRIVNSGFAHDLIKTFGKPIVSTSANISGEPTPKSFNEISPKILKDVDYVVNLQSESHPKPSTIIKLGLNGEVEIIRV